MMNFVFKLMDSALKLMRIVFKMMEFVFKMMNTTVLAMAQLMQPLTRVASLLNTVPKIEPHPEVTQNHDFS